MISRKEFLKRSLAIGAGLSLSEHLFASFTSDKKKEKLGVALVGLGYYSTDLLGPALQVTKQCELKGIVSGSPSKIEQWTKQHHLSEKNIYNYQTFDRIADNPDIDVVYVVLPPSMHAEYVIRAARAGKHVWCEKPMAMTTAECQQMIDACKKNKVKLSIGYRMHHEPNTQRIIQFRKELKYGKVIDVSAAAGYFDNRTNHWKQIKKLGGGSMYDMGVYPLNAIRYCTGEEPLAVTAKQSTTRPEIYKEVDETMEFVLEFRSGAKGQGKTSFGVGMNELAVRCAKGGWTLSPFQSYAGVQGETSDGIKLTPSPLNQQAKQMDDDALAIKNDSNVLVPGEEGLKDIRVVEAIYRSVTEGNRVMV
ncbi:MAG TPA: Gfo/Idh/MocA family oxidoreductase [Cyclobacteriaceae bacterium]|jgi:glucose-fructose oxidoreductase|nr:Gfo/Idh/MocA family oxidoreductase [Cyclobacteriaceae bacterium]